MIGVQLTRTGSNNAILNGPGNKQRSKIDNTQHRNTQYTMQAKMNCEVPVRRRAGADLRAGLGVGIACLIVDFDPSPLPRAAHCVPLTRSVTIE